MTQSSHVYEQLKRILLENELSSVEILPDILFQGNQSQTDISPFTCEPPHLGIPKSLIKNLFDEARRIHGYCRQNLKNNQFMDELSCDISTRILLIINGDLSTAWNDRKRLILNDYINEVTELSIIDFIFSKNPKAPSGWAHRQWVITRIREKGHLIPNEIAACVLASQKHSKNYHAWTYRYFISRLMNQDQLLIELNKTFTNSRLNPSDHCSHHYLSLLIRNISCKEFEKMDILENYLIKSRELIERYPMHEALWMLFRNLIGIAFSHKRMNLINNQVIFLKQFIDQTDEQDYIIFALHALWWISHLCEWTIDEKEILEKLENCSTLKGNLYRGMLLKRN